MATLVTRKGKKELVLATGSIAEMRSAIQYNPGSYIKYSTEDLQDATQAANEVKEVPTPTQPSKKADTTINQLLGVYMNTGAKASTWNMLSAAERYASIEKDTAVQWVE